MGKQTQVAMTEVDEQGFLEFLRSGADIQLIQWKAHTPDELFVDQFPPRNVGQDRIKIWNRAFPLAPEFKQWAKDGQVDELRGWHYLGSDPGGPLIEYSRQASFTDINNQLLQRGRLYWNTDFAIRRGPAYDIDEFAKWYDRVVRWVRKAGTRVELGRSFYQYWLRDANRLRQGAK